MFVLMTSYDDRSIRDAGGPVALEGTPLAGDFRYWAGASGQRYLTRALPLEASAEFPGAPVVLAADDGGGRREAVWIGIAGEPVFAAAVATARAVGACEAHVHLLAESGADARAIVRDLQAVAGLRAPAGRPAGPARRDEGSLAA